MPHRQNTAGSQASILRDGPELLVHAAGETTFPKTAVRRAYRGKKFVHFEREGSSQAINRREPDFLFATCFDLLEKVLGEVSHLGQLLLRQAMAKPELFQTKPNSIQGSHTSDRRDNGLTFLPVIAWMLLNQMSGQSLPCQTSPTTRSQMKDLTLGNKWDWAQRVSRMIERTSSSRASGAFAFSWPSSLETGQARRNSTARQNARAPFL
jgi:hypothetical protein